MEPLLIYGNSIIYCRDITIPLFVKLDARNGTYNMQINPFCFVINQNQSLYEHESIT